MPAGKGLTVDFTLLRLLLATAVMVAHFREIVGGAPSWAVGVSSTVALQAFCVVSGWVVSGSYLQSGTLGGYAIRRSARLLPLYVIVVMVQALLVVLLWSRPENWLSELTVYLGANLAFLNFLKPTLLGFLEGARVAAINPSLWTLKVEVMFYLSVPLCAFLTERYRWWAVAGLYASSVAYVYFVAPVSGELAKQLPGQLRFFLAGMACRMIFERGVPVRTATSRLGMAALALAGLWVAQRYEWSRPMLALQPLAIAALVVGAAYLLPAMGKLPDLSYGVYLLHAPVIQFTQQLAWLPAGPDAFVPTILLIFVLSLAAFYAIEQPAIRAGRAWTRRYEARPPEAGRSQEAVAQSV